MSNQASRIYVGNLPQGISEGEIEDEFVRFGRLRSIWVARRPAGFAFVEFEDQRDADEAVRKLDGFRGWRVEFSRGRGGPRGGPGGYGGGGGGYRGGYGGGGGYRERSPAPRIRRSPSYDRYDRNGGGRRSPSYDGAPRRSPSYERGGGRDRPRHRSRSPVRRERSISPRRERSSSPRRERSVSARRDRSASPRRDDKRDAKRVSADRRSDRSPVRDDRSP